MAISIDQRSPSWPVGIGLTVCLVLGMALLAAPARLPGGFLAPLPNLPLIVLFIFAVRRPAFAPPWLLALAGLVQDLLTGGPMGVWALGYLAGFTAARPRTQEASDRTMPVLIARFSALALIAYLAAWSAGSIAIGRAASPGFLIAECAATLVVFPAFAWLFARRRERSTFS